MTGQQILDLLKAEKPYLESEFGVLSIGLFGSYARGTQDADSDVDVLVEFGEAGFDRYMELKFRLEDLKDTLKPRIRPVIEKEVSYA